MAAAAGSAADAPVSGRREMYPAMEPFNSGMLKVRAALGLPARQAPRATRRQAALRE